MREIKFRAWDKKHKKMRGHTDPQTIQAVIFHNDYNGRVIPIQYTGLKDMNSKEIYEGDIVTDGEYVGEVLFHDRWYEVGMHSGKLAWCIFDKKTGEYITLGECDDEETWEIIGNVYENPEILTDKNERSKTKNQCKKP